MHRFFGQCVWRYVLWNSMYIVPYTALRMTESILQLVDG